jgi:hypothetical protein
VSVLKHDGAVFLVNDQLCAVFGGISVVWLSVTPERAIDCTFVVAPLIVGRGRTQSVCPVTRIVFPLYSYLSIDC